MKTGHTPGPWEIRGAYEFNRRVVFGAGGDICHMALKPRGQVETEANTALISAAPEMENALRSVLCNLALAEKEGRDIGAYGRLAIQAAESALAKAEGK